MKRAFMVVLLATCAAARAGAEPLRPESFAFGLELTSDHPGPVQAFTLPEELLRALTDRELGDLCLFDAQGRQVAQAIAPDQEPARELVERPIPYFPLETRERGATGGVAVSVERDRNGAITHAFSQPALETRTRVAGYLLDLGDESSPIEALSLAFAGEDAFTVRAQVEASDDLAHFAPLASGTLARLAHDGRTLRQERIALTPTTARYLRLTFHDAPETLALTAVSASVVRAPAPRARRYLRIAPRALPGVEARAGARERSDVEARAGARERSDDDEQLFLYELRGAFQPDRYRLALPAQTALVEAALESGQGQEGPFYELDRGLFKAGTEHERELPATRDKFFRLRVMPKGGGVHGGAPSLELGYIAPRLFFGGQSGSYLLAYASARARCRGFDPRQLESLGPGELPRADTVHMVRTRTLGGTLALAPPAPPRQLRVYFLWAILIAAVLVLALIARRLVRQL